MPTTVIKTIGPSGDYTTLQAALNDTTNIPTDFVAADKLVRLQVRSGAELASTSVVSGVSRTWDATRRLILEAYPGESFRDNANKLTNALTYNAANGAAIKFTNTGPSGTEAWFLNGVSEIIGLQFKYDDSGSGAVRKLFRTEGRFVGCIIDAAQASTNEPGIECAGMINTLFIGRGGFNSSSIEIVGTRFFTGWNGATGGVQIIGCTFITNGQALFIGGNTGTAPIVKDCALFGMRALSTAFGGLTPTYSATDLATMTGTGNVAGLTAANQFVSPMSDMRVKTGAALINAGTRDAANTGDVDIVGTSRSVTTPTIGAWEYGGAADVTPPNLSSAVGTQTGATTATVGATTDEANGTMYAIVSTSSTAPTATQIQAGQTAAGAAAPWSGNQAISTTGAKTFSATGLTASTAYYAHVQHKDAAGNNSTVVTSAQFTTAAGGDTIPPTLSAGVGTATGNTTATVGATTDEGNGTMYVVLSLTNSVPTAAQVIAGQNSAGAAAAWSANQAISSAGAKTFSATGLSAGTTYYPFIVHRDAAGNNSTVLSAPSFTTTAAGTLTSAALKRNNGTLAASKTLTYLTLLNDATGAFVATKTGVTTNGSGVFTTSDAGMVAGTVYRAVWKESTGERGHGWATAS